MSASEAFGSPPSQVRFLGAGSNEAHARWYRLIADHYDAIYGPDRSRDAAAFLHDVFQRHAPVRRVLDAACGTFSLGLPLLAQGFEIVGCDASPQMLEAARRSLRRAGREAELHEVDMREVDLPGTFDALLCLGTAFNYLSREPDWDRALQRFHHHLRADGVLVLDIANFAKWIDDPENAGVDVDYRAPDGTRITFFRYNEQNTDKSLHLARFLSVFQQDGGIDIAWDEAVLKVWHKEGLAARLRDHGFRPTEWWGDLRQEVRYDPAESPRLVCVARCR